MSSNSLQLTVKVDEDDLQNFVSKKFALCFTRNVKTDGEEQAGNVIHLATPHEHLHTSMNVTFEDVYQVFETNKFEAGGTVSSTTDFAVIEGGLKAKFNSMGHAQVAGEVASGKPFEVRNEWKDWARPAVSNFNQNTDTYTTIYISDGIPLNATSSLLPIKKFGVFWSKGVKTDTMIDVTTTDIFVVNLTNGNQAISYKDGKWKLEPSQTSDA